MTLFPKRSDEALERRLFLIVQRFSHEFSIRKGKNPVCDSTYLIEIMRNHDERTGVSERTQ